MIQKSKIKDDDAISTILNSRRQTRSMTVSDLDIRQTRSSVYPNYYVVLCPGAGEPHRFTCPRVEVLNYVPSVPPSFVNTNVSQKPAIVPVERCNDTVASSISSISTCYPFYGDMFLVMLSNPVECRYGWDDFLHALARHHIAVVGRNVRIYTERNPSRDGRNLFDELKNGAEIRYNHWFETTGKDLESNATVRRQPEAFFEAVETVIDIMDEYNKSFTRRHNIP